MSLYRLPDALMAMGIFLITASLLATVLPPIAFGVLAVALYFWVAR